MATILDYASPPPERLRRMPAVIIMARLLAGFSIAFYVITLFWEPGYQSQLRHNDVNRWFDNELERRMNEIERRAGSAVPAPPPVPTPVAPGAALAALNIVGRLVGLAWAIAFAEGLRRAGSELDSARPVIHAGCISKLAIVAPLLVLCIVAYVRPFLAGGGQSPVVVVLIEIGSIVFAWALLMSNPVTVASKGLQI